jgi:hypothetical protein
MAETNSVNGTPDYDPLPDPLGVHSDSGILPGLQELFASRLGAHELSQSEKVKKDLPRFLREISNYYTQAWGRTGELRENDLRFADGEMFLAEGEVNNNKDLLKLFEVYLNGQVPAASQRPGGEGPEVREYFKDHPLPELKRHTPSHDEVLAFQQHNPSLLTQEEIDSILSFPDPTSCDAFEREGGALAAMHGV